MSIQLAEINLLNLLVCVGTGAVRMSQRSVPGMRTGRSQVHICCAHIANSACSWDQATARFGFPRCYVPSLALLSA
jgi:hypothetical protein